MLGIIGANFFTAIMMYLMYVARVKPESHGAESYVLYGTKEHTNVSLGVLADRRDASPPVSDHVQLHR